MLMSFLDRRSIAAGILRSANVIEKCSRELSPMHALQFGGHGNAAIEQPSRHRCDWLVLNVHVNLLSLV
jgi:hypothetical protein